MSGIPLMRFCEAVPVNEHGERVVIEDERSRQVFTMGAESSDDAFVVVMQRAEMLDEEIKRALECKLGCDAFPP